MKFTHRRDPASVFILLGVVAAFVVGLVLVGQSGSRAAFKVALGFGVVSIMALTIRFGVRAFNGSQSVTALPPDIRRSNKWFNISLLAYMICTAVQFATHWLDRGVEFGQWLFIAGAIVFIVIAFKTRISRARPAGPLAED